jgi:phosphomevalonate kinase
MKNVIASAPGKLMLAGEYAVLFGAPAVLCAVDRRAVAAAGHSSGALLEAVADTAPDETLAAVVRESEVDSSALYERGQKLGLGSSAATVTAVVARALAMQSGKVTIERVIPWARAAHQRAQSRAGHAGSGVDVLTCVVGGLVEARADGGYRRLRLPDGLHVSMVFSGQPADTVACLQAFEAFRARDREACDARLHAIAGVAARLSRACDDNDAFAAVGAIFEGRQALVGLARSSGLALELPIQRELAEIAEQCSGAGKPTGAGGGDIFCAAFATARDRREFETRSRERGLAPLELRIDPRGFEVGRAS